MEIKDKTYTKENQIFQSSAEYDEDDERGLAFPPYEVEELDKETILSEKYLNYLCSLKNSDSKKELLEQVKKKATELKVLMSFNSALRDKKRKLYRIEQQLLQDSKDYDKEEEILKSFPPYEIDELDKETILSDELMNYLCALKTSADKLRFLDQIRDKAKELHKLRAFNSIYKLKDQQIGLKEQEEPAFNTIVFPDMNNIAYNTEKYFMTENGAIIENQGKLGNFLVCYCPILPLEEYKNVVDGTEKIKLGFYKENTWKEIVVARTTISSNQAIIQLADIGVPVTSESARFLVRYLSEIENLNRDKILTRKSVSRLGWIGTEFIPYSSQYSYGGENTLQVLFDSVKQKGNYEKWKEEMRKLRSKSKTLRLMMASSFASPFIEKLQLNSFIVHLWGKSGTGKTVTLMICASIWGNPDKGKLLSTLNSTEVGFELQLNLLHNLPAIFDEYQMAKGRFDSFDELIYKLTEGKGRDRGTKECTLRTPTTWNNIILLSGEEPITSPTSKEGVKNRVIEIEENNAIIENGSEVVNLIASNYGFAGKEFIESLEKIKDLLPKNFDSIRSQLAPFTSSTKQINSLAVILLADGIASKFIFDDSPLTIDEAKCYLTKDVDEIERYYNIIIDIINVNLNKFDDINSEDGPNGEIWGKILRDTNREIEFFCFSPTKLQEVLKTRGINWDSIKKKMAEKGFIETFSTNRGKGTEYTTTIKINGTSCRVVKIKNIYN